MPFTVSDFERMGVFYLGRRYDLDAARPTDELFLYDSNDLLTHALCIGMTGSGKTGLCLDLIEEAAIDGVPVIAIDPKGDICDLLLTFPHLSQEEFAPWVSEEDARRAGCTVEQFAEREARRWREGLLDWQQDADRVARLRASAEFAVYTPGSTAGLPVSIVGSLSAPAQVVRDDRDAYKERINSTAGPLLAMLGLDSDPLRSREHILLATILEKSWSAGKDLALADLIALVQKPPVRNIGALDLESFFPEKARFEFAMSINNLLAAPGFDTWLAGAPLLIDQFLYSASGRPKVSIFSIAHLSDSERMFFVTLLLGQLVSWMRSQSGVTSLRAILYMDEIFGFFPPVANPPSKLPLLTLLKQARAFGIGVVLASQNPVDLDYKGLANAGTWFIGRLQTERDKLRVLDGLEGAACEVGAQFNRQAMERTLAGLSSRIFLVNNVHADHQEVIETRWTLSYLRGPLTRAQIKRLSAESRQPQLALTTGSANQDAMAVEALPPLAKSALNSLGAIKPALPPGVPEYFLRSERTGEIIYKPMIVGAASMRFVEGKANLDFAIDKIFLAEALDGALSLNWSDSSQQCFSVQELLPSMPADGSFLPIPTAASQAQSYKQWSKEFAEWLAAGQKFYLMLSPVTGQYSRPNELERQFRIRLNEHAVEGRDRVVQQLRNKFAPKVTALQDKILRAEQKVQREVQQSKEREVEAAISIGATVLGAFAGRRALGRGASSAAKSAAKAASQKQEIARAEQTLCAYHEQFQQLQEEFAREVEAARSKYEATTETLQTVGFSPKKSNISVRLVALVWAPHMRTASGALAPAWTERS